MSLETYMENHRGHMLDARAMNLAVAKSGSHVNSAAKVRILLALENCELLVKDLAKASDVLMPSLSRIWPMMQDAGLIETSRTSDGRETLIRSTRLGRDSLRKIKKLYPKMRSKIDQDPCV